ncbi:MAG TPA: glutamate 5-kinase [Chloroflexota bacterium]
MRSPQPHAPFAGAQGAPDAAPTPRDRATQPLSPAGSAAEPGRSPKRARELALRAALGEANTLVVKVGSSSLTHHGRLADDRIARIAAQVLAARGGQGSRVATHGGAGTDCLAAEADADLRDAASRSPSRRVILVSSGAIAAGVGQLRLEKRPRTLPLKQAMAAVGNVLLMERYQRYFGAAGQPVAQVLLTRQDVTDRRRYLNARNTLNALLDLGVVPIVNENDTVATDEIKFGDNDNLSALVANLIGAELLVILSDVGGLHPKDPRVYPEARAISFIERVDDAVFAMAGGTAGSVGVGGMITKVQAARTATQAGCAVVIADAGEPDALLKIVAGRRLGTLFAPQGAGAAPTGRPVASRKRWMSAGLSSMGTLVLDAGACRALLDHGRSLLPVGVVAVEGAFEAGDLVTLQDPAGATIGRGLINYSAAQLTAIRGKRTNELDPSCDFAEVIHRNNMVLWP